MQGARRVAYERGEGDDDEPIVGDEYEAASIELPKTMVPDLQRTGSELRKVRDLYWLFLEKQGLSITEIELVCSMANRHRSVISRRIKRAKAHYKKLKSQAG